MIIGEKWPAYNTDNKVNKLVTVFAGSLLSILSTASRCTWTPASARNQASAT
jgi:glutathione peroxidase-family protein